MPLTAATVGLSSSQSSRTIAWTPARSASDVERVSKRIGLLSAKLTADQAHDAYLAILEPDQMLQAHVNLIRHGRLVCHARRPASPR